MYKYIVLWYYDPRTKKPTFRAALEINVDKLKLGRNEYNILRLQRAINGEKKKLTEVIKENKNLKYYFDLGYICNIFKTIKNIQNCNKLIFETEQEIPNYIEYFQDNIEYLVKKYYEKD